MTELSYRPTRPIDMRTHRILISIVATLALVTLGACAEDAGDPGSPGETSPPATSPGSTMPAETITGQLTEGVEAGCVILRTEQEDYLLLVNGAQLPASGTVTVRGYADPSMATTCQQGVPFIVEEVISP